MFQTDTRSAIFMEERQFLKTITSRRQEEISWQGFQLSFNRKDLPQRHRGIESHRVSCAAVVKIILEGKSYTSAGKNGQLVNALVGDAVNVKNILPVVCIN
jgi:hypothetical protein